MWSSTHKVCMKFNTWFRDTRTYELTHKSTAKCLPHLRGHNKRGKTPTDPTLPRLFTTITKSKHLTLAMPQNIHFRGALFSTYFLQSYLLLNLLPKPMVSTNGLTNFVKAMVYRDSPCDDWVFLLCMIKLHRVITMSNECGKPVVLNTLFIYWRKRMWHYSNWD